MKRSKPSTKRSRDVVELLPPQAAGMGVVSAAFSCADRRLLHLCEMQR